ncbi:uncharacterized protein LOC115672669 [Syzygium oleosum]|uniref:uncharacterized protein LOC115672669 n=1 Tax=Syzygium oleosum TaxID=219896 RepID=UPI0011D181B8|nr:uncharacterized protein LOC115672669 [Syzygium oleosum]
MDSLHFKNIKVEKRAYRSTGKYCRLRKIASLFRIVEICVLLVLLSRFSTQLPIAVKNSGEYFRDLKVVLVSPRFVFILGNAIIITLFAKSGQFSARDSTIKSDLYDEFLEKSEKSRNNHQTETQFQDKQILREEASDDKHVVHRDEVVKTYRRSQSENLHHENRVKLHRVLRRSATEKCGESALCAETGKSEKSSFPADSLSNEEFRRTVEAFIARQQRSLREEE